MQMTDRLFLKSIATWFLFAVACAFMLVVAARTAAAQDQDTRWVYKTIRQQYWRCDGWGTSCYRDWRYARVRSYRAPVYSYERREREEGWERRDPTLERGIACKDRFVRVVGDLHLSKDGAMNAAVRHWQATVRYDDGEKYMEIENARGYRWRCDRASTNESTLGKVGETLSGGTGYQKRCVVEARPCMTPMARGDKDDK